jgi:ASC-1-like (ASCH) protein
MDYNHDMRLGDDAFNAIRFGDKVFESRLFDNKRSKFKVGDVVRCFLRTSENIFVDIKIIELKRYASFGEMFSELGADVFGFNDIDDPDSFVFYHRKYYTEKKEKKFGVLAIKMEVV